MRSITRRIALLVAMAGVLPLLVYGVVSIYSLRFATRESVIEGNQRIASRGAEQITQYFDHNTRTLLSIAAQLAGTALQQWQEERILRNHALAFPEFRELTLVDMGGRVIASSRLAPEPRAAPPASAFDARGVARSPIEIDDDLLPRMTIAVRLQSGGRPVGVIIGELRLEQMWRLVDQLHVGEGYALVVDERGRLIAHGDPDQKARIARGEDILNHPAATAVSAQAGRTAVAEYTDDANRQWLAVVAPMPSLGWTLFVEQPTSEAFKVASRLGSFLAIAIGIALLSSVALGYFWGRSFIEPITALMRGTKALSEGRMDARVRIGSADEFQQLGDAFNGMADRLVELQQTAVKQERQAMFGRIAAGLVHDLAHPIQNIGNNCRLMLKMYQDADYRETFRRTVERELQIVRRVLEDLRNLARPIPLERFPVDIGRSVGENVENMMHLAETAGVRLEVDVPQVPVYILGDVFALGRAFRNIVLNAIQATPPGGSIVVRAEGADDRVRIVFIDTGCGIAPDRLEAIFDDFMTTKRRGLGLGLAITKKIVEQLGGTIRVESEVGRGTTFTMEFPCTDAPEIRAAS